MEERYNFMEFYKPFLLLQCLDTDDVLLMWQNIMNFLILWNLNQSSALKGSPPSFWLYVSGNQDLILLFWFYSLKLDFFFLTVAHCASQGRHYQKQSSKMVEIF